MRACIEYKTSYTDTTSSGSAVTQAFHPPLSTNAWLPVAPCASSQSWYQPATRRPRPPGVHWLQWNTTVGMLCCHRVFPDGLCTAFNILLTP